MKQDTIDKIYGLKKRYHDLEKLLSTKNINKERKNFIKLSKEYSKIGNIIKNFKIWKKLIYEVKVTEKLLKDEYMHEIAQEELKILKKKIKTTEKQIKYSLDKNKTHTSACFLEIRAATGGDEATLFAKDLFRMYSRFVEINKWNLEIINISYGEHGGYKEIITKITSLHSYEKLKFESGGHRVQRIPETESQGRIHTSSCTVAVIPVIKNIKETKINMKDVRIDFFRSSGAGGQHVNTTDSAVRLTHIPTGIVVECQNERSQHKNKSKALEVLISRIKLEEDQRQKKKESFIRKILLGSGGRSDRIRTYNFPQKRITDHRIGISIYQLNEVMNGNLNLINKYIYEKIKN